MLWNNIQDILIFCKKIVDFHSTRCYYVGGGTKFHIESEVKRLTDTKALRDRILLSGLKYKAIAEQIGITPYTLQLKIENDTEFKVSEVDKLSLAARPIASRERPNFFCKIVELNSTPAPFPSVWTPSLPLQSSGIARSLQHPCHAEDRQRTGAVSDRVGIVRLRRVYCMAGILRICSVILKKETPRRAAPAERRRGGERINHHCRRDRRCCGMAPGRYRLWGKRQRQRHKAAPKEDKAEKGQNEAQDFHESEPNGMQ